MVGVTAAASQAPLYQADSVAVTVRVDDPPNIASFLESEGASAANVGADYIEAYVPVALLPVLSEQEGVLWVQMIVPPEPAVISEGTDIHRSPVWNAMGFTGAGVKIGVIDVGFDGYGELMGTELPTTVKARCYTAVGAFTSSLVDCENGEIHGTAVAEAVFDIAPDVDIYVSQPRSYGDLRSAALWMAAQGVQVINMSVKWSWDGPGDGTSPFSSSPLSTVDLAVSNGVVWVNGAGNEAKSSWYGGYIDKNANGWIEVSSLSVVELNNVWLSGGERLVVQLRWEDDWGNAARDFDLYLYDSDINPVSNSSDEQSGLTGQYPYERIVYTAPSAGLYRLGVFHWGGAAPSWLQLNVFRGQSLSTPVADRSIANPAESANAGLLAVGAASWATPTTIENFSSRGPTIDGRVKPDVVGTDRGNSASYGALGFAGTSQASPHVAGLAALVLQRSPTSTPSDVASYLKTSASPRGVTPNNTWGYGLAQLPSLPPGPPRDVIAVALEQAALVSWSPPAADGGSSVTSYTVKLHPDEVTGDVPATPTSAGVSGLVNGRSYTFTVSASNAAGVGEPSDPSNPATPMPFVSLAPTTSRTEGDIDTTSTVDIVATLSSTSTAAVTIVYRTVDGDATSPTDYTGSTGGTTTVFAENASGLIPVVINGDDVYEYDETFFVELVSLSGAFLPATGLTTLVTIQNDDPPPTLSASDTTVGEGAVPPTATVHVRMVGKTELGATFDYRTTEASTPYLAAANVDYRSTNGTFALGPNTSTPDTTTVITVDILDDASDEFDETFLFELLGATDANLLNAQALVTVVDDDPPPRLELSNQTYNETDGFVPVFVTLEGASSAGVSVELGVVGGTATAGIDYSYTTTTVVWGQDESGTKNASVELIDDGQVEGAEVVVFALADETTAGPSAEGVLISKGTATLWVLDDEAPFAIPGTTTWGLVVLVALLGALLRRQRKLVAEL